MAFKLEDDSISLRSYQEPKFDNDNGRRQGRGGNRVDSGLNKETIFITGNDYKPSTPSERKCPDDYSRYDDNLSINQIYNKNLDRIRMLNNIEDNLYNYKHSELKKMDNIMGEKHFDLDRQDNFDEFLGKLNNIKNY
jgi:hypothetical protein